jgi:DNA-binding transcriptional LysR family regulator
MICCAAISDAYQVEAQLLKTFVTVARMGSFSAAAVELGYTQAAVSQQIASLESDLKVSLLNRRPVTPTEAGARLLEHAEPILLRLDAARADVTRMTQAPAASLVVGATPLAGGSATLAVALAALREQMPRLDVTVRVGPRLHVATGVARGALDIGLLDGLTAPGDPLRELAPLTAVGITQIGVAVVLPEDHPLAARRSVRLTDLADARWIEAPDVAPPLAEIRRLAGVEGFRPAFRYGGTDTMSLISLAAAGHGLTLLPEPVLRMTGITAIAITAPRIAHRVELVHGTLRNASPAAELAAWLSQRPPGMPPGMLVGCCPFPSPHRGAQSAKPRGPCRCRGRSGRCRWPAGRRRLGGPIRGSSGPG